MKKLCYLLILCLLLTGCRVKDTPPGSSGESTTGNSGQSSTIGTDEAATGDSSQSAASDTGSSGGANAGQSTDGSSLNCSHVDAGNDGFCDRCSKFLLVYIDFYAINDLHGKIADADTHPGVDELSTYLKNARNTDDHVVLLSAGDMWQGSSESNLTQGILTTDWMNEMDFTAMALGNHEYDWGEEPIEKNKAFAEFPLLAINIYDRQTNNRVDYCKSSVMVDKAGVRVGIIGAMGDCYSSIASDKVKDVYFKTGEDLTRLVMEESRRLRSQGADFIVYLLHDGFGSSKSGNATSVSSSQLASYYDTDLSDGYVDLVFEGHTHQKYILKDQYGVYHLQNQGDNKGGISHVEVAINAANGNYQLSSAELVPTSAYANLADDPIVDKLLNKYEDQIGYADDVLGKNSVRKSSSEMQQLVADLYYQTGVARWGGQYDIVLGGGFLSARSPYHLEAGDVTYAKLQSLFPFDNQLVLCSIQGRYLQSRFFETTNDRYYISYGDYGRNLKDNIDPNKTYYVVVDSYTSSYAPNKLTEIQRYDETTFARDLLAQYAKDGGFQ